LDIFVSTHAHVPYTALTRFVTGQLQRLAVDLRAAPSAAQREVPPAIASDPLRVDAGSAAHGDSEGSGEADHDPSGEPG
jgi:hypothetical protein